MCSLSTVELDVGKKLAYILRLIPNKVDIPIVKGEIKNIKTETDKIKIEGFSCLVTFLIELDPFD